MPEQADKRRLEEARAKREANRRAPAGSPRKTLGQTREQREAKQRAADVLPVVGNQYFKVYFGKTLISFARVSNIQLSADHEDLAEGGLNDYVHVLTKAGAQSATLTLEKGIVADGAAHKVMKALTPGTRIDIPVSITLYFRAAQEWKPVRSWGLSDGMVTRWEVSNMDALGSEIAIEKMEISHSGLTELEV